MSKSRAASCISRLIFHRHQNPNSLKPLKAYQWRYPISTCSGPIFQPSSSSPYQQSRGYSSQSRSNSIEAFAKSTLRELAAEVERQNHKEREARKAAGINVDEEEEEDYANVRLKIEKLEKVGATEPHYYQPTDSDSEGEEEEMENSSRIKYLKQYENKCKRHKAMLGELIKTESLDDAFKWMEKIDRFEKKHFSLPPEYRVIGELMNRLKVAAGKDKFLLTMKLNRALKLAEYRQSFDPNNPANYGVINFDRMGHEEGAPGGTDYQSQKRMTQGDLEDEELEFDDMKDRDNKIIEKLNAIDAQLEKKLAELEYTFGKKGKRLEEEIRELAEERNTEQDKKRIPLYRRGFDVRLVDVNRTCKVTKGGQVVKYTAILVCGNYHGILGFAKAKGPVVAIAIQKAYEKCFQNLHHVDLYQDHTIAHTVVTSYKKTKLYLWPAKTEVGLVAGRTVIVILKLAGYKNMKSKVIGSRNTYNTVKAVFKALNSIESPKDIQEKFGRTVVESSLL